MFSRVLSAAICGIQGLPIFVEADVSEGLPGFSMVGDLSAKVKEAQSISLRQTYIKTAAAMTFR